MGRSHGFDRLHGSSVFHHPGWVSGSGRCRDRDDYEDRDNRPHESSYRKKTYSQSSYPRDPPPQTEPGREKLPQKVSQPDVSRDQHSSSSSTRQSREHQKRTELSKPPPPVTAADPTIAEKMVDLKAKFPKICFDGLKFLPAIHHIPGMSSRVPSLATTTSMYNMTRSYTWSKKSRKYLLSANRRLTA